MFVHGGAWRRQSSREQAFPAEPIIAAGAAYVALNFANSAVRHAAGDGGAGVPRHSSGCTTTLAEGGWCCSATPPAAHLARLRPHQAAISSSKALVVSGIYDLLPVRLSARNEYVRLDERLEHEYSPIRHVERRSAAR